MDAQEQRMQAEFSSTQDSEGEILQRTTLSKPFDTDNNDFSSNAVLTPTHMGRAKPEQPPGIMSYEKSDKEGKKVKKKKKEKKPDKKIKKKKQKNNDDANMILDRHQKAKPQLSAIEESDETTTLHTDNNEGSTLHQPLGHFSSFVSSQQQHDNFADEPAAEFHQQQLKFLEPSSAVTSSMNSSNGSIGFGNESQSMCDSHISDITLDSAHYHNSFGFSKQDSYSQRRSFPTGQVPGRQNSMRHHFRNTRNGFAEKAAILEEYAYDQNGADDNESNHFDCISAREAVTMEKWEMLSDYRDEAEFENAVYGSYASTKDVDNRRTDSLMYSHSAGGALVDTSAGSERGMNDLLIKYLLSAGTDLASAQCIARDFEQNMQSPAPSGPFLHENAKTMNDHSRYSRASATQEQISSMFRQNVARSINVGRTETLPVRYRNTSIRSNENALHVADDQRWSGMDAQGIDEANVAVGRPDFESGRPLVEARELGDNATHGMPAHSDVVYAEITPVSLKSLIMDRSFRRVFIVITLIIVATIIVLVSVLTTRPASPVTSPTEATSMSPSSSPTQIDSDIASVLVAATRSEALLTEGTPQRKALAWMSTFDTLNVPLSDPQLIQRYSLVVLFFATGGNSWLHLEKWLDPSLHECDWGINSIECEEDATRSRSLVTLDLTSRGLKGQLPNEIGMLLQLTSLKLARNELNGTIPTQLFDSVRLSWLELNGNKMTGSIPSSISSAWALSHLDLAANQLVSSLPEALFDHRYLEWMDLSFNLLSGSISTGLEKLQSLKSINLMHNLFTGPLPSFFDNMTKLDFIYFDDNMFTGNIPPWKASMLSRLDLTISHNQLTGSIPPMSLAELMNVDVSSIRLSKVDLAYNSLSGTFPGDVSYAPSLRFFYVSGNNFTGSFPTGGVGFWPAMEEIGARDCNLDGPVPYGFSQPIKSLDFSGNNLRGTIPIMLANFTRLQILLLNDNQLSSTFPDPIAELRSLEILQLRNCSLVGTIPRGLVKNTAEIIDLGLNNLSGSIYTEFGRVKTLEQLFLDGNALSGSIPTELASLDILNTLTLNNNYLTGTIPSELILLSNLVDITVANNLLTGTVPEGLCSLVPTLGIEDIGCSIGCSCCSGREICA